MQSRYAGGERVLRVSGETRVVSMARAQHEETEDEDGEEQDAIENGSAEETAEE